MRGFDISVLPDWAASLWRTPAMRNTSLLPAAPSVIEPIGQDWIDRIDRRLGELLQGGPNSLGPMRGAMSQALLGQGKRLRPLLTLASAQQLGMEPFTVLDAGCAIEMVHAASLVFDDLPCMDDAKLRRGRPTLHVSYGRDVALLAAIGLVTHAFAVLAQQHHLGAARCNQMSAMLADCTGIDGLVGGQFEDLRGARTRRTATDAQHCNIRKTAALFSAAVEFAALSADAPIAQRRALREFALHLGCAYQLRDDVFDVGPNDLATGKDGNRDDGKRTLVGLLGVPYAQQQMRDHLSVACRAARTLPQQPHGPDHPLFDFLRHAFGEQWPALDLCD